MGSNKEPLSSTETQAQDRRASENLLRRQLAKLISILGVVQDEDMSTSLPQSRPKKTCKPPS